MTDSSTFQQRPGTSRIDRILGFIGFGALLLNALVASQMRSATVIHTWPWVLGIDLLCLVPPVLLALHFFIRAAPASSWVFAVPAACVLVSVYGSGQPQFSLRVSLLLFAGIASIGLFSGWFCSLYSATNSQEARSPASLKLIAAALFTPLAASSVRWTQDILSHASAQGVQEVLASLSQYRNPYPFGHWNYTGGYALLVLPWLVALARVETGRWRTAAWITVGVASGVLLSTFSRGAYLGLAAMVALFFFQRFVAQKRTRKKTVLAVVAIICLCVGVVMLNPRMRSLVGLQQGTVRLSEGDVQRVGMLQGGWLLHKQHPWIGTGPGMTPFVFPKVRAQLVGGVETSYQLHNTPLQVLVDFGWLGFSITAGCVLWLAVSALRRLTMPTAAQGGPMGLLAAASAYSLLSYIVFSLTDYQLNVPVIMIALALHAGVLLGARLRPAAGNRRLAITVTGVAVAYAIGVVVMLAPDWKARRLYWRAWWRVPAEQKQQRLELLHAAAEVVPNQAFYRTMLGAELGAESAKMKDVPGAESLRQLARDQLLQSLKADPAQEPALSGLGWIELKTSPESARSYFLQAKQLVPDRETLNLGLALCSVQLGHSQRAVDELALELLANPAFLLSPIWSANELAPLRDDCIRQVRTLVARILQDADTPGWRRADLLYLDAWMQWWTTGVIPSGDALQGAPALAAEFFQWLRTSPTGGAGEHPGVLPWRIIALEEALRKPSDAEAILKQCRHPLTDAGIQGALSRIGQQGRSLADVLRSSPPNGQGVQWEMIRRLHFNIMARNLDGPGIADLAPRPVDTFYRDFAWFTFPAKGVVPGPVLNRLAPAGP